MFLSSKIVSARTDRFSHFSDESEVHEDSLPTHHYSESVATSGPSSPTLPAPSYMTLSPPREYYLPVSLPKVGNQKISLPPITSALGNSVRRPAVPTSHNSSSSVAHYTPLSSEDRRVLDRFRVVL